MSVQVPLVPESQPDLITRYVESAALTTQQKHEALGPYLNARNQARNLQTTAPCLAVAGLICAFVTRVPLSLSIGVIIAGAAGYWIGRFCEKSVGDATIIRVDLALRARGN